MAAVFSYLMIIVKSRVVAFSVSLNFFFKLILFYYEQEKTLNQLDSLTKQRTISCSVYFREIYYICNGLRKWMSCFDCWRWVMNWIMLVRIEELGDKNTYFSLYYVSKFFILTSRWHHSQLKTFKNAKIEPITSFFYYRY